MLTEWSKKDPKGNKTQVSFDERLAKANTRTSFIIPVGVAFFCFLLAYFATDYLKDLPIYILIWTIISAVGLIGVPLVVKNVTKKLQLFMVIYIHIIGLTLVSFFMPFPTPFFAFYMVLSILAYISFGYIGITFSALAQLITIVSRMFLEHKQNDIGVWVEVGVIFAAVTSMSYFLSYYLKLASDELRMLNASVARIAFERERLLTLINNMKEAVIACDSNLNVLLYNSTTSSIINTNEPLFNKSLDSLVKLKDSNNKYITISELIKNNHDATTFTDYIMCYNEHECINLYISINRIDLNELNKDDQGYIVVLRDITKQKSLEEERNEFIAIMSHELRTPVTVVEGGISLARMEAKKDNNEALSNYLDKAYDQAQMLGNIVNSLSTLVRNNDSTSLVNVREVDPRKLIELLSKKFEQEAAEKNLQFNVEVEEGIINFYSNNEQLFEILQNFISNAIKYTKNGAITLKASNADHLQIAFSVTDTGIGISKSDLNHVFEKFWRSENFQTRETGGTGIGLYIASLLAREIGAKIEVTSEPDKGSTFTLLVPRYNKSTIV